MDVVLEAPGRSGAVRARYLWPLVLLSLLVSAAFAFTHVVDPLNGDTALFLLGAIKMHAGSVLYRDFWDLKQPGIYLFYLLGGELFGFTYFGSFVLTLLLWAGLAVVATAALRRSLAPLLVASIPLFTMGAYFAGIVPQQAGQVEGLVGPFLFGSVYAAVVAVGTAGRPRRLALVALSGLLAGLVLLAKLILVIVVAGTLLGALAGSRPAWSRRSLAAAVAVWLVALVIPILAFLPYAVVYHELGLVLDTWFVVPPRIARLIAGAPVSRLVAGAEWFAQRFTPLVVLGALGCVVGGRRLATRPWYGAMVGWVAASLVAIVVQKTSWFDYHFLQLTVPLGILSVLALDWVVTALRSSSAPAMRAALAGLLVVVLGLAAVRAASSARLATLIVKDHALTSAAGRLRFQTFRNSEVEQDLVIARYFMQAKRPPGELYVAADPLVYFLADRSQGIAINGWDLELLLPDQWTELSRELAADPPRYLFVADYYAGLIAHDSPPIERWLREHYRLVASTLYGQWFAEREDRLGRLGKGPKAANEARSLQGHGGARRDYRELSPGGDREPEVFRCRSSGATAAITPSSKPAAFGVRSTCRSSGSTSCRTARSSSTPTARFGNTTITNRGFHVSTVPESWVVTSFATSRPARPCRPSRDGCEPS